jgi:hypothetical protein
LSATATGAASGDTVKYYVEGATAADLTVVGRYVTSLTATSASGDTYGAITDDNTDAAAKIATIDPSNTWVSGKAFQFALKLDATNVTSTSSVKVTPFVDNVLTDDKPGANELTGTPVTITFNKGSELTATPTLKALTLGVAAKATVAVDKGINLSQFRAQANGGHGETPFTVQFKKDGAVDGAVANVLWNTTDSEFVASSPNTVAAGSIYGATAKVGGTDSGSAALVTASAGEVSALSNVAVAAGTSYRSTASNVNNTTNVVRSGAGSLSASTTVTVAADKSKSGQKVTFTVTETGNTTIDAAASIAAGGKTLTNAKSDTQESFDVDVLTDADGKATLAVTYTGLKAGNTFSIDAKASGSAAVTNAAQIDLAAQDSQAHAIVDLAGAAQAGTAVRQYAKGSAVSAAYQVVDQFGQVPTGTFQVTFSGGSSINYTANVAVSNGTVSFNGTDANTADASYTITATLKKRDDNGDYQAIPTAVSTTTAIQIGTVGTPASLTVTANATDNVVRSLSTLVAGNSTLEQGSVSRTVNGGTYLNTTVIGSTGAVVDGATVTYSAPGVLFRAGNVHGLGSITVLTDGSGTTGNVNIYSNNTGKQTITVTSGSATKTQVITFAAAANTTGSAWTVTAPAYILPGQTLKVSAKLVDKYGAAVETASGKVKVVYTGAGFVTATLPTTTDADGVVSFNVLLGAADSGTSTVKFIYAGANGNLEETSSNDDVVANASIALGAAPVAGATAAIAGSTKRFFVSVSGNSTAKNVVVKVAGKTFKTLKGSTAKKTYLVAAPKGSHKVTVFVGGKLVATKTVSVK